MIFEKTADLLKNYYGPQLVELSLSDVQIGLYLTAVRLSDGSCGVAGTVPDSKLHCKKEDRDFGQFSPSRIRGEKVISLLETSKRSALVDSLRIAVLNALSAKIISNSHYKILENTDPVDLIDLSQHKTITIVGGFQSYIRKIAKSENKLFVLELDQDAISEEYKKYYVPADRYKSILPQSDIIIITGLALVNNTIEGLLSSAPPDAMVIVTGPSSSIIPDILFNSGVNLIGATRVKDPVMLFRLAGEGGTGYHLFNYCAEKICIVNENKGIK